MLYQSNPFQFKEYKCLKCGKVFDAGPRVKFGKCPESTKPESKRVERSAAQATFKKKWSKRNQFGYMDTYEEWTASSEAAAKAYLNTRQVTEAQYYVVVETPEGCWGKDRGGVYKE
jgi:hypothetical protein